MPPLRLVLRELLAGQGRELTAVTGRLGVTSRSRPLRLVGPAGLSASPLWVARSLTLTAASVKREGRNKDRGPDVEREVMCSEKKGQAQDRAVRSATGAG